MLTIPPTAQYIQFGAYPLHLLTTGSNGGGLSWETSPGT